jgi:hypothetical protein
MNYNGVDFQGNTIADFDTLKTNNFNDNRRLVYHYAIFAHDVGLACPPPNTNVLCTYSGYAEVGGNDLIVSFGGWHPGAGDIDGDGVSDEDVGTETEQVNTLMHELGHNLNLQHGGSEDVNGKPNYLSVMNYRFQWSGILPTNRLDYSGDDLDDLNENSLDEGLGIQDGTDATRFSDPSLTIRPGQGTGSIDWDWDGTIEGVSVGSNNVAVDINYDPGWSNSGTKTTLTGWDDWENILYDFQSTGGFEDGVHPTAVNEQMTYLLSLLLRTPTADAGGPYVGYEGTPILLDASGSVDPNGDALQFRWDFDNDGTYDTDWSDDPTAQYTWYDDMPGDLPVVAPKVEVSDGIFTDSSTCSVTVYNVAPTVTRGSIDQLNPQFILPMQTLTFHGTFSDPGCLDTHTANWAFGDGQTDVGTLTEENLPPDATGTVSATHAYSAPGVYSVTVTVTDDDLGATSAEWTVHVADVADAKHDLAAYIQNLPPSAFKSNVEQRKATFANKFKALDDMITDEEWNGFIMSLQNDIRTKADGQIDGKPADDWINDKIAQEHICMKVDDIVAYVKTFM